MRLKLLQLSLINSEYKLSEQTDMYFNAALSIKKVNFANYRTPYWRTVESMPYLANFFLEIIQIMLVVMMDMSLLLKET
jgi:hypothetical protein